MKRPYSIAGGLTLLVALVAARALTPILLEQQINRELAALDIYTGSVGGVDLHLWRGAYSIQDARIIKRKETPDQPLFTAERITFSARPAAGKEQWLVANVHLAEPRINFLDREGDRDRDQDGAGANWLSLFDKLSPLPIDRLGVDGGEVHFFNFAGAHVHLAEVDGNIAKLSETPSEARPLPARLNVEAQAMGTAPAELQAELAPRVRPPAFALKFHMQGLDLADLRLLAKTYAPFDVEAGEMDLVMELSARDGEVDGYAKPLLRDLKIISLSGDIKQDKDDPVRLVLESFSALVLKLLENRSSGQIATRIPISGELDAIQRNWWAALGGVLSNAFIDGLQGDYDSQPAAPATNEQGKP